MQYRERRFQNKVLYFSSFVIFPYVSDHVKSLNVIPKIVNFFTWSVQGWIGIVSTEGVKQISVDVLSNCTASLGLLSHTFLRYSIIPVENETLMNRPVGK